MNQTWITGTPLARAASASAADVLDHVLRLGVRGRA